MSDALWTSAEIETACAGLVSAPFTASGVSIDTRTIEPGDLFVALAGVRDGHEFVAQALAKGAAGALVSQNVAGPHVKVADVFAGLQALGRAARARPSNLKCAAVTGSVGKTSVTQAIAAGLMLAGQGHGSVKSYNNHIGVPLTLARMARDTRRAVFEIGMNHADEITPLSQMVRPDVAVITNVGPVHIENFPDGEPGVARAKAEIFDGMGPGGLAILNADNRWFSLLAEAAQARGVSVVRFGSQSGCEGRVLDMAPDATGQVIRAELYGRVLRFPIAQTGDHWGLNALAVLLANSALGVDEAMTLHALAGFAPLAGRGAEHRVTIDGGGFVVVDESFNANPVSMEAVINTLGARVVGGRRIVALTDMLELGPDSLAMHAGLASSLAKARIDKVFCAGPMMQALWDVLPADQRGGYAPDADKLAGKLNEAVRPGDVVLVKGSKGSKASRIVEALLSGGIR